MVKNKNNQTIIVVLIAVVAIMFFMKPGDVPTNNNTGGGSTSGGTVDLCPVVSPTASFTAQRLFLAGTSITTESVRVIKMNGGTPKDLGYTSLNSGTLSTAPNGQYKLYWGENSTSRYTNVESYTAPCQEAVDDKMTELCTADTTPTVVIYDEDETSSATWALGQDEEYTGYVKVSIDADSCYGNPNSPKGNALCFEYEQGDYVSITLDGAKEIPVPYAYQGTVPAGNSTSCYEIDLLSDNGDTGKMPFTMKSNGDPSGSVEAWVFDVGFDLNADTLEEIWGFEDEDNGQLGFANASDDLIIT